MTTSRCKHIALLLFSLLAITACRTVTEGYRAVHLVIDNRGAEQRFKSITDRYARWQTFTAKGRFSIAGKDEEMSASMQMRMVRDDYVFISLRGGMGIEGGKVFINADSLYIVDKINKCYIADKISTFTASIPISLAEFQDLLLCRAFATDSVAFSSMSSDGGFVVSSAGDGGVDYDFGFDCYNMLGMMRATADGGDTSCKAAYKGYVDTSRGILATSISIVSQLQGSLVTISADYTPSSIVWNKPLDDNFAVPKNYRQIDAALLLQQLGAEL